MRSLLVYITLIFALESILTVEGSWCNETKTQLKEEYVPYEEVVIKRKESVMCRLRGYKPASCTYRVSTTKSKPHYTNETVVIPKCCEGYEIKAHVGCDPVCNITCSSRICTAPNVCKVVDEYDEEFSTSRTEVDYYDENGSETSTPEQEAIIEQVTTEIAQYVEEGPMETTFAVEEEVEGVTKASIDGDGEGNEGQPGAEAEEATEENKFNWILWASVFSAAVTFCVIGYVIFAHVMKSKVTQVDQVVSYSK